MDEWELSVLLGVSVEEVDSAVEVVLEGVSVVDEAVELLTSLVDEADSVELEELSTVLEDVSVDDRLVDVNVEVIKLSVEEEELLDSEELDESEEAVELLRDSLVVGVTVMKMVFCCVTNSVTAAAWTVMMEAEQIWVEVGSGVEMEMPSLCAAASAWVCSSEMIWLRNW